MLENLWTFQPTVKNLIKFCFFNNFAKTPNFICVDFVKRQNYDKIFNFLWMSKVIDKIN